MGDINYEYLTLSQLRNIFHEVPFFQTRWKTVQTHYNENLEYIGDPTLKPEEYNPRYTGKLLHNTGPAFMRKYGHLPNKQVRLFYERICCAGKNGCDIPEVASNKKFSKFYFCFP